jgi:integrase
MSGGIMGLYKRKNSNIWQMCFHLNGKKIRMSTKTSNKKVAQRIYEKARVEAAEGKFIVNEKGSMPFSQLVDEVIEKHSKVEKASFERDIFSGKVLKEYFKDTPIGKITAYDIKSWRKWRREFVTNRGTKISKASLNLELNFLKLVFNLAVEWQWLVESPAAKVKKLRGETKRLRFLSREEVYRLIDWCPSYLKPIIITAVSTGMRRGEIFNLKWEDVDFENGFIRVVKSKNQESRDIPMDEILCGVLQGLKESRKLGGYVFCHENGEKRACVFRSFKGACRKAGIEDFRFHDLRHTAASLLACGGCDIIMLKNVLGHKSLEMTQRYAHLMPDTHEKTRRVMSSIWVPAGHTFWDTPQKNDEKETPESLVSKGFDGHDETCKT